MEVEGTRKVDEMNRFRWYDVLAFILVMAFILFLQSSCVRAEATHEPVTAPDGARAILIECPRSRRECLAEASEVCPNGYAILDQEAQARLVQGYNGQTWTAYKGQMVVRCKRAQLASDD